MQNKIPKIKKQSADQQDGLLEKIKQILLLISVEPLMLLDGLQFSNMSVFIEDLQMRKICHVELHQNETVCSTWSNYSEISDQIQLSFSLFAFYDGILKSAIPLFFILFMGAWSDKYGRKLPLYTVQLGHVLHALGLLVCSINTNWPVEYMLIPTFLDSLGGGNVCFLTATNAYLSDITSEKSRTTRVGIANSIFFLGGPIGTFIGRYIYEYGGYQAVFSTSLFFCSVALFYVMFIIKESHGPNAIVKSQDNSKKIVVVKESIAHIYGMDSQKKHQDSQPQKASIYKMIRDFFNPQRIMDSFKCTFKSREGNTRTLILLVILCSLIRRLSRSPYVFAFTRHALSWQAEDYSMWVTYKNLMATIGTLVAVPLLSGRLQIPDYILGTIGSCSNLLEYILYGLVIFAGESLFWIAPVSALLVNSITIAQRSMLSKFVTSDELGKVSAVLGALDGIMPMVNYFLYMLVYKATVIVFPGAHFFLGAGASAAMFLIFFILKLLDRSQIYDVENAKPPSLQQNTIVAKRIVVSSSRLDSYWLTSRCLIP